LDEAPDRHGLDAHENGAQPCSRACLLFVTSRRVRGRGRNAAHYRSQEWSVLRYSSFEMTASIADREDKFQAARSVQPETLDHASQKCSSRQHKSRTWSRVEGAGVRMPAGIDAKNVQPESRKPLVELAREFHVLLTAEDPRSPWNARRRHLAANSPAFENSSVAFGPGLQPDSCNPGNRTRI
jgi:hypothetical protein